ncbi:MAG: NAD(P)/FAD-dependent oxidoreductase [Roseinatronobacter sp.]
MYEPAGYDTTLTPESYWHATCPPVVCPPLSGSAQADVLVIGAGFAGLNAALELVERFAARVIVVDAAQPGWGASGRNGGFCCLGGTKLSNTAIARHVGQAGLRAWQDYEAAAIERVRNNLDRYRIDAQASEQGELLLTDSPRAQARLTGDVWDAEALAARGLATAVYRAGRYVADGFGLHPLAYVTGLARAALGAGVTVCGQTQVTALQAVGDGWQATTPHGTIRAARVLVATNGYTDERLVPWLARRLVPAISNILVTRPLSDAEIVAQGWTRTLMAYDARFMLHYFRLLPDRRFLFGARGGLSFAAPSVTAFGRRSRAEFDMIFPAFAQAQTEFAWNGLVCLTTSGAPFIGPVPGVSGLWLAMGWHGNGVAAASEGGRRAAQALIGGGDTRPALVRRAPPQVYLPRKWALRATMAFGALADGRLKPRA